MLVKFSIDFDEYIWQIDVPSELESASIQMRSIAQAWEEVGVLYVYQSSFEMLKSQAKSPVQMILQKNFAAELKNILTSNMRRIQIGDSRFRNQYIELIQSIGRNGGGANVDGIELFGVNPSFYEQTTSSRMQGSKFIAPNVEITPNRNLANSKTFEDARKHRDFQISRHLLPEQIWQKFSFERFLRFNSVAAVVDRIHITDEVVRTMDTSGLAYFLTKLAQQQDRGVIDIYLRVRGTVRNRDRFFDRVEKQISDLQIPRLTITAVEDDEIFEDYPKLRYFRGGQAIFMCDRGLSIFDQSARAFDSVLIPSFANVNWQQYEGKIRDYAKSALFFQSL